MWWISFLVVDNRLWKCVRFVNGRATTQHFNRVQGMQGMQGIQEEVEKCFHFSQHTKELFLGEQTWKCESSLSVSAVAWFQQYCLDGVFSLSVCVCTYVCLPLTGTQVTGKRYRVFGRFSDWSPFFASSWKSRPLIHYWFLIVSVIYHICTVGEACWINFPQIWRGEDRALLLCREIFWKM